MHVMQMKRAPERLRKINQHLHEEIKDDVYIIGYPFGRTTFVGYGRDRETALRQLCSNMDTILYVNRGSPSRWRKHIILWRDGSQCRYCGRNYDLTVDHIMPRSKGGTNALGNLQILCHECNHVKDDKILVIKDVDGNDISWYNDEYEPI